MCLLPGVVNDKSIVCILIDLFGIDCRSVPNKKDHCKYFNNLNSLILVILILILK